MGLDTAALDNSPPDELPHDHHLDCGDPPPGSGSCGHYLEEQFQISLLLCMKINFLNLYIRKMTTKAAAPPPPFFTCSTGTFKCLTTDHIFN